MAGETKRRNKILTICILFAFCLNVGASILKVPKYARGEDTFSAPCKRRKLLFLTRLSVLPNEKRQITKQTNILRKKKQFNKLFEQKEIKPERKLEWYELNVRNDKKFPKYAKKPAAPISNLFYFSPFRNITDYFEPIDDDIKTKLKTEGFQFDEDRKPSSIFPSLNDIINNGDPTKNIHYYRRRRLKSLLYGDPLKFVKTKKVIAKYNRRANEDKQINYDDFSCDIYYVHSNGTIMNIEHNRPPYDKKIEESERYKEPRFIITAKPGHARENNLNIGDKFPIINEEEKKKLFDNHFSKPKKIRDPLVLPDGRKIP